MKLVRNIHDLFLIFSQNLDKRLIFKTACLFGFFVVGVFVCLFVCWCVCLFTLLDKEIPFVVTYDTNTCIIISKLCCCKYHIIASS